MKIFTLTKLGRTLLMLSAVLLTVGIGAVFAQQPTLDKLEMRPNGKSAYYAVPLNRQVSGAVVIPATYNSLPVVFINGFASLPELTSVTIPAGAEVNSVAFDNCKKLTSVTFQGSNNKIGSGAFNGDLKVAYEAYGAGTYTRPEGGKNWTKQNDYASPPPSRPDGGGRRHGTALNGIWTRNDGTQITISDNGQIFTVTDGNGRFTRTFTER